MLLYTKKNAVKYTYMWLLHSTLFVPYWLQYQLTVK